MIRSSLTPTVVKTNHACTPGLLHQTNLSATNTDKLNLRLIRAATYLLQFLLNVKHKPGCNHKIPNALSHLLTKSPAQLETLEVEALYGTLIELSNGF